MRRAPRFSPGIIDYDGSISVHYATGRALSSDTAEVWRTAVEPFVRHVPSPVILDLGAGTGRFSDLLAWAFGARVIGLDPSRGMLRSAPRLEGSPSIAYVAGMAEELPLREHSCDFAWLSQVLHHVSDRRQCARELRRVLRTGGRVLVRGTFGDHLDGFPTLFRFFPGARDLCAALPGVPDTVTSFEAAGLPLEASRRVRQRTCESLRDFAARTRLRADTALALLPEEEFTAGLAALEEAVRRETKPSPVIEIIELLVFRT
ncbi:MAG: class I SAM-dependent methyltransferase [Candidatus Binatia bacterium]